MFSFSLSTSLPLSLSVMVLQAQDVDTNKHRGLDATFQCISQLRYPVEAQENNISGTVIVLFDIDSNCTFKNFRIEKSVGYGCDEEAIRAISQCKKVVTVSNKHKCIPQYNLRQPISFVKPEDE